MLTARIVNNRQEWDQALLTLPAPHILQSWDWGDFKQRWGWKVERLLWVQENRPLAAAQVLQRPISYTPWNFLYTTKGPLLDYANMELASQILAELETYARNKRALFIKIDPDIPYQFGQPHPERSIEVTGQRMLETLHQRGWYFSPEQIQFRNTVILNLTPKPEEMLAAMKSKWRYNIRLAQRKGVRVQSGSTDDLTLFYRMYAETSRRDGFLIRPEAYYRDVWGRFMETGRAEMLLAWVEEEPVAGLILFIFGQTAWYMYGASTGRQRQLMPNHLLQWAAINLARERGCFYYDMWGAPDQFVPSDPLWSVYHFKQGFGGEMRQGLGAFDYPPRRALYRAFTWTMPRVRSVWRGLSSIRLDLKT